jgi:hypothetical protein
MSEEEPPKPDKITMSIVAGEGAVIRHVHQQHQNIGTQIVINDRTYAAAFKVL